MCLTVSQPCATTAASHACAAVLSLAQPQPCPVSAAGHLPPVARSAAQLQAKKELSRQAQLQRLKRDLQDACAALGAQACSAVAMLADLQ